MNRYGWMGVALATAGLLLAWLLPLFYCFDCFGSGLGGFSIVGKQDSGGRRHVILANSAGSSQPCVYCSGRGRMTCAQYLRYRADGGEPCPLVFGGYWSREDRGK